MSYATVAQLREYLSQVTTGSTEDAKLQAVLDRAYAIVNGELGFSFAAYGAEATSQDVMGKDSLYLVLPAHSAGTVASVYLVTAKGASDEDTDEVDDWTELSDGRLYLYTEWSAYWYRVAASWGYGSAPNSVVEVELEVAVNIWRGRDAGRFDPTLGEGGGARTGTRALSWGQRDILTAVKREYEGYVFA